MTKKNVEQPERHGPQSSTFGAGEATGDAASSGEAAAAVGLSEMARVRWRG
ncbi:MAG: hypothetical protein ACYTJ0_11535 [Planctomycetota bacterium]|jgi:hypothetical protein